MVEKVTPDAKLPRRKEAPAAAAPVVRNLAAELDRASAGRDELEGAGSTCFFVFLMSKPWKFVGTKPCMDTFDSPRVCEPL